MKECKGAWDDMEFAALDEIFASLETIASQAWKLPGRSVDAIGVMGRARGLTKAKAPEARVLIDTLMSDGIARSAQMVSELIGAQKDFVRDILNQMSRTGVEMHVEYYDEDTRRPFYKAGSGQNASKPAPLSSRAHKLRHLRKVRAAAVNVDDIDDMLLDEAHRDTGKWWPRADVVVLQAINAMVASGRAQV